MLSATQLLTAHKETVLRSTPKDVCIVDVCIIPADKFIYEKVPRKVIATCDPMTDVALPRAEIVLPLDINRPQHLARLKLELVHRNIYRVFLRTFSLDGHVIHGLQRELQRYGGIDIFVTAFDIDLAAQMVYEGDLSRIENRFTDGTGSGHSRLNIKSIHDIFIGHWALQSSKTAADFAVDFGVNLSPTERRIARLYKILHFQTGCSWRV